MTTPATAPLPRRFALLLLIVFLAVLVRTAWLSDDALISLRSVMNVTHGFGLTFNVAERVQTFTHPLWVLLLTPVYLILGNIYYAPLVLSLAVSLPAIWLALTRAASREQAIVAGTVLLCSRAFIDFATSGLENPLSYLLLALFAGVLAARPDAEDGRRRWVAQLVGLASLLYLTRPDEVLIVLPPLAVACWQNRRARLWRPVAIGLLPAAAWTAFSIVYYGFPFPNTAYAKLSHGIDQRELWQQGMLYAIDSLNRDPLTLIFVAFAVVLAAARRSGGAMPRALAVGIVLYLAYVARIGGDFMAGRFFAVPLFVAVLLVSRLLPADAVTVGARLSGDREVPSRTIWLAAAALLAVIGISSPLPPLSSDSRLVERPAERSEIIDERAFYFKTPSLVFAKRETFPQPEWVIKKPAGDRVWDVVDTCGLMGRAGLDFGPGVYLLDECALADPLMARLPAAYNQFWRPGHFRRIVPPGYRNSMEQAENRLDEPRLREYYEALSLIIRSTDFFSPARVKAIVKMNVGGYDGLIDYDTYRYGGPIRSLDELSGVKEPGTPWDAPGVFQLAPFPLVVRVEDLTGRRYFDVSLDSNDTYRIHFLKKYRSVAYVDVGPIPRHRRVPGLATYTVDIPQPAVRRGFDTVYVTTLAGDDRAYAVGHLLLDKYPPTGKELLRRVMVRDGQIR